MGIAGYIIGGAMQGLGQGMALKQKAEDEDRRAELAERRAIALENQRSQNLAGREAANNDAIKEREALNDQRDSAARKDEMAQKYGYESQIAGNRSAAESALADKEFRQKLTLLDAETQAEIKKFNATYRDEISNINVDEPTGAVTGVTKSGNVINLSKKGAIARKLPKASATDDPLGLRGDGPTKPGAPTIQIARDKNGNLIWPE